MDQKICDEKIASKIYSLDQFLSKRSIDLDPLGYVIIKVDYECSEIIIEHYSNDIDDKGIAIDPETGLPISCNQANTRKPINIYRGRSAKEVGIKITEQSETPPISKLDHALYIGRELQRAEDALIGKTKYVQD